MSNVLFESTTEGIIRYFVRPDDDFVLNSLEKMDADGYLYRVLKSEGYERIVFIGMEKTTCKYYAYDKLSHLSFIHYDEFTNVILDSQESVSEFYSRVKIKLDKNDKGPKGLGNASSESPTTYEKIPELGKREINSFSRLEVFASDFATCISEALEAENIKTAVVIQMEVFEQSLNKEMGIARKIASELGDIVRYCEKENSIMQNIVVLTTTQKEKFINLVNNELLHNFHSWVPEVLSEENTSGAKLVWNITGRLEEYGCLVMSQSIGVDEIANLLLRKKIIENDTMFDALPFSKIYPLAEKLKIHMTHETKVFSDNIPFERRRSYIKPLNALLQRRKVVDELIKYAQSLESKEINHINAQSVSVERIFHNKIKYIDIDDSAEIIAEFDKLEGVEIQDAKRDVLRAINYFKRMKEELEEKEKQGRKITADDYPYYNMLFFGAPGTGKSTIAELVGKLMYAKGILPTSKVHIVQASHLGSGTVHRVQEKLFKEAEKVVGGVLVIDELQGLKDAYHNEDGSRGGGMAEDLMKGVVSITNKYRGRMSVILCGYEKDVLQIIEYDDGADRRYPEKIKLKSYSIDTLMVILHNLLVADGKTLADGADKIIRKIILADMNTKGRKFGNVGYLKEQLIRPIKAAYFERGQEDNIYTIADVEAAFPMIKKEFKAKRKRYKKINRVVFENLPAPYGCEATESKISLGKATDPAILFIKTDKCAGTAFLISPDGYAITCNHVIEGATEITARLRIIGRPGGSDSFYKCEVVNTKKDYDIALIKLLDGSDFPYLKLAKCDRKVIKDEEFSLSGYPFGDYTAKDLSTFHGSIASNELNDDRNCIVHNINSEAKCGNSGAPIIARSDGCVIGILLGSITKSNGQNIEEINQMRPIKYFWEKFLQ